MSFLADTNRRSSTHLWPATSLPVCPLVVAVLFTFLSTGRPLGLVVSVNYMDEDGKRFSSAVFNETVQIIDDESAFNPET